MTNAVQAAVGAMSEAARRWLDLLDDGQRGRAVSGFPGEPERSRWFYAPTDHGEPGQPHYYRIQGPRLLAEFDNAERHANHIHTVWRDPQGDFARDVLAEHYATSHR